MNIFRRITAFLVCIFIIWLAGANSAHPTGLTYQDGLDLGFLLFMAEVLWPLWPVKEKK